MVELLVALAVFATVMSGISVVFISSMRAWRTGRENRSVFQMARAASQFMQRDITSAFGSVDRDEVKTLVGTRKWLTFVGITENPVTRVKLSSEVTYDVPHSDVSRITYRLIPDPEVGDQFLLVRLVEIDSDVIGPGPVIPARLTLQAQTAWNNIILDADPDADPNVQHVQPDDFELASNILDMGLRYGVIEPENALAALELAMDDLMRTLEGMGYAGLAGLVGDLYADSLAAGYTDDWAAVGDVVDGLSQLAAGQPDNARQAILGTMRALWDATVIWYPRWDSRYRTDRKLPDVIEVSLTVRAAAKMPNPETMVRVFRTTIFLPLGYRRPMPVALR